MVKLVDDFYFLHVHSLSIGEAMGKRLFGHWKEHAGSSEEVRYTVHALYGLPRAYNVQEVWKFASVFRPRYVYMYSS